MRRELRIGLERTKDGLTAERRTESDRLAAHLEAHAATITALRADMAAVNTRLGSLPQPDDLKTISDALATLTTRTEEIGARLEAHGHERAAATHVTAGPAGSHERTARTSVTPSPAAVRGDPRPGTDPARSDLYQAAYLDFSRGNYALAIGGFREFVRRHPEDEAADNAQYWIGEAYFSLAHRYADREEVERATQARQEAAQAFREVGKRHPFGDKVPAALYREALVLFELQQPEAARARLGYLIDRFPRSPEARLGREHLGEASER
jgi:tol-pal system protein YbgF